ncbi:hypothetical protein CF088_13115 [Clostridium botulinum]|uniref:hypothetical protein n=1 Tax=Clostridium botulinum TaxID=1491 RepID=UPI000772EF81|nr:hypothetical protein [Clostridium botulinum]APH22962.1 hypothetical protein NPD1_3379 [Clostridium botulinum]APQ68055.1 hypothetical protein RSJ8_1505 [Clostridium botulinum]MBN3380882.1 hypothetical protein [Clostridium botulinum]MBN3406205.1 hypothetical protein [Clostridium botulinum]QDY17560.1 hypothetical protein CGQ27_10835 [Clostridium botulinum]
MVKKGDYSNKEDNFIKNNYLKMTNKQLAKKLNRSSGAIATRLTKLNLRRIKKSEPKTISEWMDIHLSKLDPNAGVGAIKNKFKISAIESEKIYKNWRKKYTESRVI